MSTTTILYTAPLNRPHYFGHHMPMVDRKWTPLGLKSWTCSEINDGTYTMQCFMQWESADGFANAAKVDGEEILGDIKNYSPVPPMILHARCVVE